MTETANSVSSSKNGRSIMPRKSARPASAASPLNSTAGSGTLYKEAAAMDGAATTVRAAQIKVSAQVQISYALN